MSGTLLTENQKRMLRSIFERGAENASRALSTWLNRQVRLEVGRVDQVEIEQATEAAGPGDSVVAFCGMAVEGRLSGQLLLVFEDQAGLALADLLQGLPIGSTTAWGDLERSAAQETANIVGCAYVNALASHLPGRPDPIVPGPPTFRHEFAAGLIEFAVLDQAAAIDHVLLIQTRFLADPLELGWSLLFVPSASAIEELANSLDP